MPNKVKIIKIYLNIYFIGLPLYSEEMLYSSTSLIFKYCISYRNHPASWRNIRAHPGARRGLFWSSGQHGRFNWGPKLGSEEPEITDPIDTSAGKPRCIILLISNYATYRFYLLVHLSCWSWLKTLVVLSSSPRKYAFVLRALYIHVLSICKHQQQKINR